MLKKTVAVDEVVLRCKMLVLGLEEFGHCFPTNPDRVLNLSHIELANSVF